MSVILNRSLKDFVFGSVTMVTGFWTFGFVKTCSFCSDDTYQSHLESQTHHTLLIQKYLTFVNSISNYQKN